MTSFDKDAKLRELATSIVDRSIVTQAVERFVTQIIETCAEHEKASVEALRAQNADLMAALGAAREYGAQARLREKAAEDKRIHDTDALRAQNAELVTALLEIRWRMIDAGQEVLAIIDAALAKAKP